MLLKIGPLREYRDYRWLYFGHLISFLGSMVSYVAVPYQVYELTKSNALVGALGLVQLGPVLVFGLLGGTIADRINRRRLLLVSEVVMTILVSLLALNALLPNPSILVIFLLVAIMQAVTGFHRPAMEASAQKLVHSKDYAAIAVLGSFRSSAGAIVGPAIGGILIAAVGVKGAFLFNALTFLIGFFCIWQMSRVPDPEKSKSSTLEDLKIGLRFAASKPELIGTYMIDIVAMIFAFPVALFPAMSVAWGGAKAAGILFSAMAIGSLVLTLFSGWADQVKRTGRMVVIAAALWGVCIAALGFAEKLWVAVLCLALAGAADMLSGLFRGVIWNRTVPNELRGRMSGIEMISYMTGPLLGNARAGWVAAEVTVPFSLISGGLVCVVAVILTAIALPKLWRHE